MKKTSASLLFLLWTGIIITIFYVVQKPNIIFLPGLLNTIWTLLVAALLLFNAFGLGKRVIKLVAPESLDSIDHLLFSLGIGLGILGLLGLAVSVLQIAQATVLVALQLAVAVFFLSCRDEKDFFEKLKNLWDNLTITFGHFNSATKIVIFLPLLFSFLLTLVPPFESFDALLYHLAQPATILREGGLHAIDNPPFWFPNLTENVYLWALALGSERAAQVLHFAWSILTVLLLWFWSMKVWGIELGRKTLLLITAMPSLTLLASWAYADMALSYYAIASIYTLTSYRKTQALSWLQMVSIFAGLAMGVKYTSFIVPLTCGLIILFQSPFIRSIKHSSVFSFFTLLIALPWYLRNALVMANPFYPFVFGGMFWDDFLATWYADAGSGIGWNTVEIFKLPFNLFLGHRDVTYFDGRFGPLYIVLFPLTVWALIEIFCRNSNNRHHLTPIIVFFTLSFAAWSFGVINSSALWQTRLLFPAMLIFAIPTALGWNKLSKLNSSKINLSFLINAVIGMVIMLVLVENAFFIIQRNPLAVALGAQSREAYIARVAPSYLELMKNMDNLPIDAHVYFLFEPRSYDMPRLVQPDALITNFAHDHFIFVSPEAIVQGWDEKGYTHILVYETGMQFMLDRNTAYQHPSIRNNLVETLDDLILVSLTSDGVYSLYKIP